MRKLTLAIIITWLLTAPGFAQQPPMPTDPALLQRMLAIALSDRAQLLNSITEIQARHQMVTEELTKAQARVKELEKVQEPAPEKGGH